MTLEVNVDRELCIGSENCVRYAPGVFETDETGKACVKADAILDETTVRLAVSACPVGALSLAP